MTMIMIVAGFLFCSVSAYMAGLVGSSNNPVSGITICTILFAVAGADRAAWAAARRIGPVAAIMIGAVVCCAACIARRQPAGPQGGLPRRRDAVAAAGDARDRRDLAARWSWRRCSTCCSKAYGIGVPHAEHPQSLIAPQATLMASVAKGMFGGELPWTMIAIGARDRRRRSSSSTRS